MENDSCMHGNMLQQLASSEATTRGKKTWLSVQEAYQTHGGQHLSLTFQLLSSTEVTRLLLSVLLVLMLRLPLAD